MRSYAYREHLSVYHVRLGLFIYKLEDGVEAVYTLSEDASSSRSEALNLTGTHDWCMYGSENVGAKVRVKWSSAKAHLVHRCPWNCCWNRVAVAITC